MAMKSDPHIFSGMQRDMSISKHQPEFLYDALNIRLTAREGSTMMSMTNERGTRVIQGVNYAGSNTNMEGTYVGHCAIDDKLVVFTTTGATSTPFNRKDHIYILYLSETTTTVRIDELYFGDLGFDTNYPLETLGVYENDHIQKVYWVDGKNTPKVINIYGELNTVTNQYDYKYIRYNRNFTIDDNDQFVYIENSDTQFDFVPTLNLAENISIARIDGAGMFASGVIQYAFAYYNKYGQESNIFYVSPIKYISFTKRGGSPEEKVSNTFKITVSGFQTDFDFLRVFSIHRTSLNATPTVKRVADIEIDGITEESITIVDDGQKGDNVDPTELLYIGGESIVASTMTQKDNTLFLGDLKIARLSVDDSVKEEISKIKGVDTGGEVEIETVLNEYTLNTFDSNTGYYSYTPVLNDSTPGFKIGEHYRLGLQFQHANGKWSEPVFVEDYTVSRNNGCPYIASNASGDISTLHIPNIKITPNLSSASYQSLINSGYKRVRGVCVSPTIGDRLVLTQGMLCPTVYNRKGREKSAPFAQSSWFLRPFVKDSLLVNDNVSIKADYNAMGNVPSFQHLSHLGFDTGRDAEIQGAASGDDDRDFCVDQSIITMHSPDIEFDTSFNSLSSTDYKLRLIGAIMFVASIGDIDIQTSTPANNGSLGFTRPSTAKFGVLSPSVQAGRSLLAGAFWNDKILQVDSGTQNYKPNGSTNYMIYPWHRSGSLNNDNVRPADKGARTAVLQKKKISNLKFSDSNYYFRSANIKTYDISQIQLFDSDQLTMLKVPYPDPEVSLGDVTYYGNIDTMLNGTVTLRGASGFGDPISSVTSIDGTDAGSVRMKYKSTRHLVFSLLADNHSPYVLPSTIGVTNIAGNHQSDMFWLTNTNVPTSNWETINYVTNGIGSLDGTNLLNEGYEPQVDDLILDERTYTIYWVADINYGRSSIKSLDLAVYNTVGKKFEYGSSQYLGTTYGQVEPYSETGLANNKIVKQDSISEEIEYPYLFLGELVREPNVDTDFGGNTEEAMRANLWLPAGEPVDISQSMVVEFTIGDTWFQRYDCLKTYPFTLEDENSVVEIGSFLCETRVNIDGRYDKNRGNTSNLTTTPTNFNLLNEVYSQPNNFFNYRLLDEDYYKLNNYRNTITWSKEKVAAADVDLWTNVTLANTLDLDGSMGKVNALKVSNDTIFCFQDTAVSRILFNSRVQIPTSDNLPIEITNSYKVDGKQYISDGMGCTNKWSIVTTPSGLYFIDSISGQLYNIGSQGIVSVSGSHGFTNTFKSNRDKVWSPISWDGPRLFYDNIHNDLYLVYKNSCLVYSEILGQFTSFMSYEKTPAMMNIKDSFIALKPVTLYYDGDVIQTNLFMYKLWEGEYNEFFGYREQDVETNNISYKAYYKPFNFTFVSNSDGALDKSFTNVEMRTDFRDAEGDVIHRQFFDYIQAWDEYQDTGVTQINNPHYAAPNHFSLAGLKKKFRIWRIDIPRAFDSENNKRTMQRIRNTWAMIKFGMNPDSTQLAEGVSFELHDLAVQYHI